MMWENYSRMRYKTNWNIFKQKHSNCLLQFYVIEKSVCVVWSFQHQTQHIKFYWRFLYSWYLKRRELIETNEVYSYEWLFCPSFTPVLHHHDSTDVNGVILIYTRIKEGRIMPLLFLSTFTISVEVLLFKSHQEKEQCKDFCVSLFLYSLFSLSFSPLPPTKKKKKPFYPQSEKRPSQSQRMKKCQCTYCVIAQKFCILKMQNRCPKLQML